MKEESFARIETKYMLTAEQADEIEHILQKQGFQLIYRVVPGSKPADKQLLDAIRTRNGNLPVSLGRIPETRTEM